jgi:hypothetical protein
MNTGETVTNFPRDLNELYERRAGELDELLRQVGILNHVNPETDEEKRTRFKQRIGMVI